MRYFLKRSSTKKGDYLQIYETTYDPETKRSGNRAYQKVGYVTDLVSEGIEDPVAHYRKLVEGMNARLEAEEQERKARLVGASPEIHIGHFPLKAVLEALGIEEDMRLLQRPREFGFDLYGLFSALVYARAVGPCSKRESLRSVMPRLHGVPSGFSYDQVLACCEFLGQEYKKVVEILTRATGRRFGVSTGTAYFDCTNFYFEIDREDLLRRRGPSKENRHDPIVGMGLLLDADQIPVGMHLYPGNESERPVLPEVITELKERYGVTGRVVQVADKGLNCARNIYRCLEAGDGYIFSKSVKKLPEAEKAWVTMGSAPEQWTDVTGRDSSLLYRYKTCVDVFPYEFEDGHGGKVSFKVRELRVLTYNPELARKKQREIGRQVERARGLCAAGAKREEFGDSGKYVRLRSTHGGKATDDRVELSINWDKVDEDRALAGYNLLVTSELGMDGRQVYKVYHNLWRIEESFRLMKSELDARPVFLQREDRIKGHFLICYASVLLLRLLQVKVCKDELGAGQLLRPIRSLSVVPVRKDEYVNVSESSEALDTLAKVFSVPARNFKLTEKQLSAITSCKLPGDLCPPPTEKPRPRKGRKKTQGTPQTVE